VGNIWTMKEDQTGGWRKLHNEKLHNLFSVKGKGKVVPVLFLNEHHALQGILGEWKYSSMHSLTSALDGGEWSVLCPSHFTPWERAPGTHWIGGWVSPRAGLDMVVKRKIPSSCRDSNP
jgi:hypothetical protein